MGNVICAAIILVIAFASYTQWQKEKGSENQYRARIWMIVSVLTGAGGVIEILALLFG